MLPYPGLQPASPPIPPPVAKGPRPPRSKLARITLSLLVLAMGLLAVLDVAGPGVPGTTYLAVLVGGIGLALLIGAWFGRAHWLILPGIVLSMALFISGTVPGWIVHHPHRPQLWSPASVSQVDSKYSVDTGDATLDLSQVDFTDQNVQVSVSVDVGHLVVIVPPNVDTVVRASVDVGDAVVFDQHWGGVDKNRTVKDDGADGPGGGQLNITASVDLGQLEVRR
jgi:hypothetical protein